MAMASISLSNIDADSTVVCLGAHCDDLEIGCGATLAWLAAEHPGIRIVSVIFCDNPERESETRKSLASLLPDGSRLDFHFGGFRDGFLPHHGANAKEFLADLARDISPAVVFTHNLQDLHQDHRFVAELSLQVFRRSMILGMEIPKYDGDLGRPNLYFPASKELVDKKIAVLMEYYASQRGKDWFTKDTFQAIMRLRGIECRAESGFAEAFYSSKLVVA